MKRTFVISGVDVEKCVIIDRLRMQIEEVALQRKEKGDVSEKKYRTLTSRSVLKLLLFEVGFKELQTIQALSKKQPEQAYAKYHELLSLHGLI